MSSDLRTQFLNYMTLQRFSPHTQRGYIAAVSQTLQAFAKDPQWKLEGQLGFISVLHTWSQTLMDHFHLHGLVPGGALSFSKKRWIAYAKRPFAGPEQVLEYLGRYTHRIAISNNRIKSIDNGTVTFEYRDRSRDNQVREMSLSADEFIRRFLLHVLPSGFMKIRYFGFLSNNNKKQTIPLLRKLIDPSAKLPEKTKETIIEMIFRLTGEDITCCPECKKGKMRMIKKISKQMLNSS